MRENDIKNLLAKANLVGNNSDLELEIFESILNFCYSENYRIEDYVTVVEDCSICEQQKFIHLVALENDTILDLVYDFHKTFANTDFCKEDLRTKFQLQMLENTFEIAI